MSSSTNTARLRSTLATVLSGLVVSSVLAGGTGAGDPKAPGNDLDGGVPPQGVESNVALTLSRMSGATGAFSWFGVERNLNVDPIQCNGNNIGRIDFKYRIYGDRRDHDGNAGTPNRDVGGAALEGGFTHNGGNHCAPKVVKAGTSYKWVQMIDTNVQLQSPPAGEDWYLDAKGMTWLFPWYPFESNDTNPAGNPFTGRSFYDGPSRYEQGTDIDWTAKNMLVCTHGWKINVIGTVTWGFEIDGSPNNTNGALGVDEEVPTWAGGGEAAVLRSLRKSIRPPWPFDSFVPGYTVSEGCCCEEAAATLGWSDDDGDDSQLTMAFDQTRVDEVVIFPRNRQVLDFLPCPPGWQAQPWPFGNVAPILDYQLEPEMLNTQGLLVQNMQPDMILDGIIDFPIVLQGHESLFDVYVHLVDDDRWVPYTINTQVLIGDANLDGEVNQEDFPLFEFGVFDPVNYQQMFPNLNPAFVLDVNHDDQIDLQDFDLFATAIFMDYEADAQDIDDSPLCSGDVDGDGTVDVTDMLAVLGEWGGCADGCTADINFDGMVDVIDLLAVLAAWGPCEES